MVRTQVRVPMTGQKYHCPRHKKMLYGYDYFSTYAIVVSLKATTNFGRSEVWHHIMTLDTSRVGIGLSHNNKNIAVLSTLFVPYLHESYEQILSWI